MPYQGILGCSSCRRPSPSHMGLHLCLGWSFSRWVFSYSSAKASSLHEVSKVCLVKGKFHCNRVCSYCIKCIIASRNEWPQSNIHRERGFWAYISWQNLHWLRPAFLMPVIFFFFFSFFFFRSFSFSFFFFFSLEGYQNLVMLYFIGGGLQRASVGTRWHVVQIELLPFISQFE